MRRLFGCITLLGIGFSVAAFAEQTLKPMGDPIKVQPQRVAKMAWNNGEMQRVGPWLDLNHGKEGPSGPTCCSTELCWDAFDSDGACPGFPSNGDLCGLPGPGYRWFFGTTYCNTYVINDMVVADGCNSAESSRAEWAWFFYGNGQPPPHKEQCFIVIFTGEGFNDTCNPCGGMDSPAWNCETVYDGVIYDFGLLNTNPMGYYFTDTEDGLCGAELFHQLPMDGMGSYLISMLQVDDPPQQSTCAQAMLWGNRTNIGSQGGIQWDDDAPRDRMHTAPDECYDYTGAVPCPDPLGSMLSFYAGGGGGPCQGQVCGDANCDGMFDNFDINDFVQFLTDPAGWRAGHPDCDELCVIDANHDGSADNFDIEAFVAGLTSNPPQCPP